MQRIHLRQQADVSVRVAARKGLRRSPPTVGNVAFRRELCDGAGHLGPGQARHLGQVTTQQPFVGPGPVPIIKAP